MQDGYDEAKKIVQGVAKATDFQKKIVANEEKRMPSEDDEAVEEAPKVAEPMPMSPFA